MRQKYNSGFTLIELLVVIGIIAILASTVMLALNSSRRRSRDAKRAAEAKQMSTALEVYNNDFGGYPADPNDLETNGFVEKVPVAPDPPDGPCDSTSNTYTYTASGTAFISPKDGTTSVYPDFAFTYCLGGDTEGTPAGPHTLTPAGIQ